MGSALHPVVYKGKRIENLRFGANFALAKKFAKECT